MKDFPLKRRVFHYENPLKLENIDLTVYIPKQFMRLQLRNKIKEPYLEHYPLIKKYNKSSTPKIKSHDINMEDDDHSAGEDRDHLGNLGPNGSVNIDTVVQAYAQEYENLDQTLDEIDSWMNKIEEQNDTLSSQLDDLLESSKQARRELQEMNQQKQSEDAEKSVDDSMDTSASGSSDHDVNEKQT